MGRRSTPQCRNGAVLQESCFFLLLLLLKVSAAGKDDLPMVLNGPRVPSAIFLLFNQFNLQTFRLQKDLKPNVELNQIPTVIAAIRTVLLQTQHIDLRNLNIQAKWKAIPKKLIRKLIGWLTPAPFRKVLLRTILSQLIWITSLQKVVLETGVDQN